MRDVLEVLTGSGGDVLPDVKISYPPTLVQLLCTYVICGGQRAVWPSYLAACVSEAFEGLWRGDLVNEMPVNVEQDCAVIFLVDDVVLEDLVIEGSRSSDYAGHFCRIVYNQGEEKGLRIEGSRGRSERHRRGGEGCNGSGVL